MPILPAERSLFPDALFADDRVEADGRAWWVLHTRPRREKSLARDLHDRGVGFYLPLVSRRSLVRGRPVQSFLPLFPGYLFLLADRDEWMAALSTGHVARPLPVADQRRLWYDLGRLHRLMESGLPIAREDRLAPGTEVVIRSGPLEGLRGKILKAASGRRFVVQVDFIQQGASVLFEDCRLEPVDD
jgi:transcriptional antiterminator RfaH